MKNSSPILPLIGVILLAIGCQSHKQSHPEAQIPLNNGKRWVTDEPTRRHATSLLELAETAAPVSLADFHAAGDSLQAELDNMFSDCRMTGPAHDALHVWLVPIVRQNAALDKAATVEDASRILAELKRQIAFFPVYFE
jgi:hypothetical protein